MSKKTMARMGSFCKEWGVKAWRIGGDSEPLLNKDINVLVNSGHAAGIEMGLVTNGVYLDRIENPSHFNFIGISLDAATADTWAALKASPRRSFSKILDTVRKVRDECPELDLSLKFVKFSDQSLQSSEFLADQRSSRAGWEPARGNAHEVDEFRSLAEHLGCNAIVKDCYSIDFRDSYQFTRCLVTPLSGVFDASHRFHLCCDARDKYVLTNDYTRNDWNELKELWSSDRHRRLVAQINPKTCLGCAKHKQNEALQNYVESRDDAFI